MKDGKKAILKDLARQYCTQDHTISYLEYSRKSEAIIAAEDGHDIHHYNKILEGVK